jgi:hypothetical protein
MTATATSGEGGLAEGGHYFSLIDDLRHARKTGDGFLGKLFLVEGRQATSQEEHAVVVALARQLLDVGIRIRP